MYEALFVMLYIHNIIMVIFIIYRIHYVVGKACVKVWATKILAEFQHCLGAAENGVTDRCQKLEDLYVGTLSYS